MAEDKKGFLLYCDTINSIEHLTNEEKGVLFQHLLEYVNDLNPILEDRVLIGVWKHIENQLKRDLKKYEAKVSKSSLAGREGNLKRWNLDLYEEYKKGVYSLEVAENIASGRKGSLPDKPDSGGVAKIADKDNVTVTVNDTVIDKDKVIKKKIVYSQAVHECFNYSLNHFPKELHPKKKEGWLDTLEKLNRIDGYSFDEIKTVIKKTREDPFWSKNFLSINKLRKKDSNELIYYKVFKNNLKQDSPVKKKNWWDEK